MVNTNTGRLSAPGPNDGHAEHPGVHAPCTAPLAGAHARALRSLAPLARWGGLRPPQTLPGHRAMKGAAHEHSIPQASMLVAYQHSGVHPPCTAPQRRNTHAAAWHITCDHHGLGPMRALTRPGHAWHDAAPMQRGMDVAGSAHSRAAHVAPRNATGISANGACWSTGRPFARWKCTVLPRPFPHSGRASEHAQSGRK